MRAVALMVNQRRFMASRCKRFFLAWYDSPPASAAFDHTNHCPFDITRAVRAMCAAAGTRRALVKHDNARAVSTARRHTQRAPAIGAQRGQYK